MQTDAIEMSLLFRRRNTQTFLAILGLGIVLNIRLLGQESLGLPRCDVRLQCDQIGQFIGLWGTFNASGNN